MPYTYTHGQQQNAANRAFDAALVEALPEGFPFECALLAARRSKKASSSVRKIGTKEGSSDAIFATVKSGSPDLFLSEIPVGIAKAIFRGTTGKTRGEIPAPVKQRAAEVWSKIFKADEKQIRAGIAEILIYTGKDRKAGSERVTVKAGGIKGTCSLKDLGAFVNRFMAADLRAGAVVISGDQEIPVADFLATVATVATEPKKVATVATVKSESKKSKKSPATVARVAYK